MSEFLCGEGWETKVLLTGVLCGEGTGLQRVASYPYSPVCLIYQPYLKSPNLNFLSYNIKNNNTL